MFIRPWAKILIARMKRPDGWHISDYHLQLATNRAVVCRFYIANGYWFFELRTVAGEDAGEAFELRFIEKIVMWHYAKKLIKAHHNKIIDGAHVELITRITGLD